MDVSVDQPGEKGAARELLEGGAGGGPPPRRARLDRANPPAVDRHGDVLQRVSARAVEQDVGGERECGHVRLPRKKATAARMNTRAVRTSSRSGTYSGVECPRPGSTPYAAAGTPASTKWLRSEAKSW